jgi:hypothetical protein
MNTEKQEYNIDFSVNKADLYREENITDLRVASIRRMIPIKEDGSPDESRTEMFFGHSQLVSPQGPVPLQAQLMANTFEEAIAAFPDAMQKALENMVERIKKMQEEQKKKQEQEKPPKE